MLRQLAGPFPLVDGNGVPVTVLMCPPILYHPQLGLLMKCYHSVENTNSIDVVTLDGVAQRLNSVAVGVGPLSDRTWHWDLANKIMMGDGFAREPVALCTYPYPPLNGPAFTVPPFTSQLGVFLADRHLGLTNVVYNGLGTEFVMPSGWGASDGMVGPGRNDQEVFLSECRTDNTDLRMAFYDHVNRRLNTQTFHLGTGARGAAFAPDLGVIIALHDTPTWQISIWSLDVVPYAISPVTLKSGSTGAGTMAVYQAQVQGQHGDWVVGAKVDWEILSGPGELLDAQTITDDNGFARCRVFYPAGATGTAEIGASLTC